MLFRLSLFNTSSPTRFRAGDFILFTYIVSILIALIGWIATILDGVIAAILTKVHEE
uniref:Uncharacterized protein n=1 Tax=Siphoviridae sp. ctETl1 TaxID=2826207 RepID=A0A8S5QSR8_9CAUD|nr:MAG TPA: hypothetical protein [Siphoviridae sp. ctETl1]